MGKRKSETEKLNQTQGSETINLFISASGGVGKTHLVKTIYQSITKLLQYHGGPPEKP